VSKSEAFTQSLYEDADLREDLTDEEAAPLFEWASGMAHELEAAGANEEEFEAKTKQLRQLIKKVNRFVGQRSYVEADAHQQQLDDLRAAAQTLGLAPPDEPITASAAQPSAYMGALLTQLKPEKAVPAQAAQQETPAPETPAQKAPTEEPPAEEAGSDFRGWRSWLNNLDKALSDDDEA